MSEEKRGPCWEDLDRPKGPEPRPDEFAELCARLLTSADGKKFVEMLRDQTIEADLPLNAGERQLFEMEGQRKLVRRIERSIRKGLDLLK